MYGNRHHGVLASFGLEDSTNRTARLWQRREERAVSTLGSNRCNSTLLSHVSYGMGKRSGDDGWGYLEQSPSTACLAGPLVTPQ